MFVKQIDMVETLWLAAVSQETNIMALDISEPKQWADYSPDTLQNLLEGCLFFRSEPTMSDFELGHMTCGAPPINKNKSGSKDSGVRDKSTIDGHPKRTKRVGKGRMMALHEVGRSSRWITDDTGLHERTVHGVLKEMREENREKD